MRGIGSMSHRVSVNSPADEAEPNGEESAEEISADTSSVPPAALVAGLLAVFGLAFGSLLLSPGDSELAVWWPAAGLGVVLVVLTPARRQWAPALGVAVATGAAEVLAERGLEVSLGLGLANGVEAYVVGWLLSRGRRGKPRLRTMEDLWRFLSATALGAVLAAVGSGLSVVYGLDGPFTMPAVTVFTAHAAAVLTLVPLALRMAPSALADRRPEVAAQVVLLLVSVGYVFGPDQTLSLTFAPLPLLLWASLRFGLRMVSFELVAVGVLVTALTAAGGGPFAEGAGTGVTTEVASAALAQTFVVVTALVALLLTVAVAQRRTALTQMAQSEELFHRSFQESFVGMLLLARAPEGLVIRELNQTAADVLGGSMEDFLDEPLQPLLETGTRFDEVADRMGEGDVAGWREELWLTSEPGRRVAFAMSAMSTGGEEEMFSAQMMDVTDVYVATTRLQTEKDFTSAVLNTTACLIVVLDVEGNVAGLNPAGEEVSGRTEAEVLDKPLWGTLAPSTEQRRLRELLDRTRPGRDIQPFEGDLVTADGQLRRIVWSIAPLLNDVGRRTHVVLTGIDVTDERNVRSMTNHLLDVATSTAFIGVNLLGTVTIFNAGAQELLGYSAEEATGRLQLMALHEPDEIALAAHEAGTEYGFPAVVDGVMSGPRTRDWTYVRKDGSRVACAVTMSAIHDAFGSHIGYLAVARDMSDSHRSQKILTETLEKDREATARLRDLDRAKSDFVSMVSHEIRTPITNIVGYTEMLQDGAAGPLSREQDRLLDAVRRNGRRLIGLIDDLLTLSRIESGSFTLKKTEVDLLSVFDRAHEAVDPLVAGRRLGIDVDLPHQPVLVLGDAEQLERVVESVLTNAVKFTEDGGHVQWSLSTEDGHAVIEVEDNGIGIAEDEQADLFTRFFRSRAAQERAIQGSGLGLAIAQWIVHGHGGEITVRSREHVGTLVQVVLPLLPSRHRLDT